MKINTKIIIMYTGYLKRWLQPDKCLLHMWW